MTCPKCASVVSMSDNDVICNNIRLAEQKEIRLSGTEFRFNMRYTCPKCGNIFIEQTLRRK